MSDFPEYENPIEFFDTWFAEARTSDAVSEPTAMTLATVDDAGMPDARIVLLKDFSDSGFTFYTNLGSTKAQQLTAHPKAALCFHWVNIDKQVRIQGEVTPVSDEEADAYFFMRPRQSQIGAWASIQSTALDSRETLEARVEEFTQKYEGLEIPRPPFWSGFRLKPSRIEFWLRAAFRLHHRRIYERTDKGTWKQSTLYP